VRKVRSLGEPSQSAFTDQLIQTSESNLPYLLTFFVRYYCKQKSLIHLCYQTFLVTVTIVRWQS